MPSTIRDILERLSESDRSTLMVAFEEGVPNYIQYMPGRYIGVYTDAVPHLNCEQSAGSWREGRIRATN